MMSVARILIVLNAIYIALCATLNYMDILNTTPFNIKIIMIALSTMSALYLLYFFICGDKEVSRQFKGIMYMDILLTIMWNILMLVRL